MDIKPDIPLVELESEKSSTIEKCPRLLIPDIKDCGLFDINSVYHRYVFDSLQYPPSEITDKNQKSTFLDNNAVFCRMILGLDEQEGTANPTTATMLSQTYEWVDDAIKPSRIKILKKFAENNLYDQSDLEQTLHVAMLKSIIPKFDPEKSSFNTYYFLRGYEYVKRYVTLNSSGFKVPVHSSEDINKSNNKTNTFRAMGTVSLQEKVNPVNNTNIGTDTGEFTYESIVPDKFSVSTESRVELRDEFEVLCTIADKFLTPKQREAFFLFWLEDKKLKEIATEMGCTISNVSWLIKHAKARIAYHLHLQGHSDIISKR